MQRKDVEQYFEMCKNGELNNVDKIKKFLGKMGISYTETTKDLYFYKQLLKKQIIDFLRNNKEYLKEIIKNAPQYDLSDFEIMVLLEELNDIEFTKRIFENRENFELFDFELLDIIKNLNDIDFVKDCLKNREKYKLRDCINDLINLVIEFGNKDELKEIIINRKEYKLSGETVAGLLTRKVFNQKELLKLLDKETGEVYRKKYASPQFIKEHLKDFLEIEGNNVNVELLLKMAEKNEEIFRTNFDILEERYISILGEEKVSQIACYPYIVDIVLGLSDEELEILGKALDKYIDMTKGDEWTPLASRILENIGSYKELVSNLGENRDVNINRLIPILIHTNDFDIKTVEDVENFKEIKIKKCEELIKGETIEEKQKAVLLKIFGQGIAETKELISKFGEDIDKIQDENLRAYVKSLQEILRTKNSKVLEEIFYNVEELETNSPILMERMLKTEYWKLYNNDLFKVENAKKLPDGENVYSAGTDFKMIITFVSVFSAFGIRQPDDYNKDWNRASIKSQNFCASYIRNDMLGHLPIKNICYGFGKMKEDSLMLSGTRDIYSSVSSFVVHASGNDRYLAPDTLINRTKEYNEMDFRRVQDGEKKQPDYIVVFRKDGKIPNMDKAQKASKDFGGLPIVVIDEDECLASEKQKAEELFEEYKETGDPEIRRQLEEKLRNNRVTDNSFCRDTNMDAVLENRNKKEKDRPKETVKKETEAKVTMEDLDEIYGEVSARERQEETGKIKGIYRQIRNIKEREDDSDAR